MRRDRRATWIAAGILSRRSTRRTTSAASARGRGTLGAHGDAEIGGRKGRGIVDAVADHHHGAVPLLGLHDGDLPVRREIGMDRIECNPTVTASATSRRSPEARTIRAIPKPTEPVDDLSAPPSAGRPPGPGVRPARRRPHRHDDRPDRVLAAARAPAEPWNVCETKRTPPTMTRRPSTVPSIPSPGISSTSVGSRRASPLLCASGTRARAMTCFDAWSSDAASRRSSRPQARHGRIVDDRAPPRGSACRSCR